MRLDLLYAALCAAQQGLDHNDNGPAVKPMDHETTSATTTATSKYSGCGVDEGKREVRQRWDSDGYVDGTWGEGGGWEQPLPHVAQNIL